MAELTEPPYVERVVLTKDYLAPEASRVAGLASLVHVVYP